MTRLAHRQAAVAALALALGAIGCGGSNTIDHGNAENLIRQTVTGAGFQLAT
jgi:hypothetical protein